MLSNFGLATKRSVEEELRQEKKHAILVPPLFEALL